MITWLITLFVFGTLGAAGIITYLLPVLIGWYRHVPDLGAVAVINIALGWTLFGWVIALAMALRSRPAPAAAVHVYQSAPPISASPPPPAPIAPWAPPPLPPPGQDGPPAGQASA